MRVKDLIDELKKLPKDTEVLADDGTGWVNEDVYLDYDKRERRVIIAAR